MLESARAGVAWRAGAPHRGRGLTAADTPALALLRQVNWPELQAMFRDTRLNSAAYVFTEGMDNCMPASSLDIEGTTLQAPSPMCRRPRSTSAELDNSTVARGRDDEA